jgi:hypothetical protein
LFFLRKRGRVLTTPFSSSQWDRLAKLAGDTPPSAVPEPRADPDRVDKDVAEALLGSFSFAASASTRAGNAADISEAQRNGNVPNPSSSSSSFGNGNASAQISDLLAARMELFQPEPWMPPAAGRSRTLTFGSRCGEVNRPDLSRTGEVSRCIAASARSARFAAASASAA